MPENLLVFRTASPDDIPQIWSLLHEAQVSWNDHQIAAQLPQLYVLIQKAIMMGVLWEPKPGSPYPEWIITHPLYPANPYQILMMEARQCLSYIIRL